MNLDLDVGSKVKSQRAAKIKAPRQLHKKQNFKKMLGLRGTKAKASGTHGNLSGCKEIGGPRDPMSRLIQISRMSQSK